MSVRPTSVAMLACLGAILATPATLDAAPPSYPLVCRGGGQMDFSLSASPTATIVTIRFQQGTRGVAGNWQLLAPGECSWMDRGVSPQGEPFVISHTVPVTVPPNHVFLSLSWNASKTAIFTPGLLERHPYLEALTNPGGFQVFKVYNDGRGPQGYFIVTGLGE